MSFSTSLAAAMITSLVVYIAFAGSVAYDYYWIAAWAILTDYLHCW